MPVWHVVKSPLYTLDVPVHAVDSTTAHAPVVLVQQAPDGGVTVSSRLPVA